MELVSVVVCTYNRSASLRQTLEALRAQQTDGFDYELLVVDNNSHDDTRTVVEALVSRFGGQLRYLFEGQQGQSPARNAGLAHARGGLIAFTDDDVLPSPDWLLALRAAIVRFQADCAYGKILPRYLAPPPAWMGSYFLNRLAIIDRGNEARLITATRDQFACANVALTRRLVEAVGRFNMALGDRGGALGGEEDTDYFNRVLAAGFRVAYTPEAVVYHTIGPDRMTKDYFRRWHYGHGMAQAHITSRSAGRRLFGIPFWVWRAWAGYLMGYVVSRCSPKREHPVIQEMRLLYYTGLIRQLFRKRTRT